MRVSGPSPGKPRVGSNKVDTQLGASKKRVAVPRGLRRTACQNPVVNAGPWCHNVRCKEGALRPADSGGELSLLGRGPRTPTPVTWGPRAAHVGGEREEPIGEARDARTGRKLARSSSGWPVRAIPKTSAW
jgi:hypothetical protein